MSKIAAIQNDVIYDLQFKQKLHISYFPLTWQGIILMFFCWLLPLNLMESGGIFLVAGFILYRMAVVKKDHEVESTTVLNALVTFLKWINKSREASKR